MVAVPQEFNYEIHYPMSQFPVVAVAMALASDHEKVLYLRSSEAAGSRTGGPLMRDGGVACAAADDLEAHYWASIYEGVSPCYVEKGSGYVFIGDWIFVPTKRPMIERKRDG